jgi:hyperosmotically inducible periplasmic protein
MNITTRKALFAALILGTTVAASGCDQRNSSETVGQKLDRATDKVAATTDQAASKTAEVMDDATLTTKVKAAILAEPGLRSLQIGVETHDAVVTLTGSVDSLPLKERAHQVATNVAGVHGVVDNLVTKPAQSG